jgi:acyl-coenzyme A synthetase/AMP-(fatty) acid ligase
MFGSLLHGSKLVIGDFMTTQDPERLYDLLCRERVTILNHTPSVFRNVIREDVNRGGAISARYVFLGGEALHFPMLEDWVKRHPLSECKIVNLYGPTEATVLATFHKLCEEDLAQNRSIIGKPITGSLVVVRTQDGAIAVPGVPGELVIAGAGVACGYYKRDESTEERFVSGPGGMEFRTGDLAKLRIDGDIEFLGRIDRQVKVRGFRLEPAEIEAALRRTGKVVDCAVDLVHFDGGKDARLVAYVQACGGRFMEGAVRDALKESLPSYMIPPVFVEVERIPTTTSGKVDFAALSKRAQSRSGNSKGRTETERWLSTLVAKKLKHDKFDVTDNLLDVGLASLDIVELVSAIRERNCHPEISVLDVFEHPTVQALGGYLDSRRELSPKLDEGADRASARLAMLAANTAFVRSRL